MGNLKDFFMVTVIVIEWLYDFFMTFQLKLSVSMGRNGGWQGWVKRKFLISNFYNSFKTNVDSHGPSWFLFQISHVCWHFEFQFDI